MNSDEFNKNGEELAQLLESKIKNYEVDYLVLERYKGSRVVGKIDGKVFNISVKRDEYLLVSAQERDMLESIQPLLTEYMGNVEPICQYKLTIKGVSTITIEWNIKNPTNRIMEIVNVQALENKITELQLFGYNVEDFPNEKAKKNGEQEAELLKNVPSKEKME